MIEVEYLKNVFFIFEYLNSSLMQGLSKFERERLERIRRNNEYLKELGLDDEKTFVRKKRHARKKKTSEEPMIRRRSYVFFNIRISHPLSVSYSDLFARSPYVTLEI